MSRDNIPQLTVDELKAIIAEALEVAQARIEAYEERVAIVREGLDDGYNRYGNPTDQRAIDALDRDERYPGEHQVAKAWLMNSITARIFKSGV